MAHRRSSFPLLLRAASALHLHAFPKPIGNLIAAISAPITPSAQPRRRFLKHAGSALSSMALSFAVPDEATANLLRLVAAYSGVEAKLTVSSSAADVEFSAEGVQAFGEQTACKYIASKGHATEQLLGSTPEQQAKVQAASGSSGSSSRACLHVLSALKSVPCRHDMAHFGVCSLKVKGASALPDATPTAPAIPPFHLPARQIAEWLSFRNTALRPLMDARLAELNAALAGERRQPGPTGRNVPSTPARACRRRRGRCSQLLLLWPGSDAAAATPRPLQASPTSPAARSPPWRTWRCTPLSRPLLWPSRWRSTATSATCCGGELADCQPWAAASAAALPACMPCARAHS